jgi:RNA binding exosome subunit
MERNTPILQEIIEVLSPELDDAEYALDRLENHFHNRLIVDAGTIKQTHSFATQLRLEITEEECSMVLDEIATQ